MHDCECDARVASYQRLAALYHDLLGRESLEDLLARAADAVGELVPCSSLVIARADADERAIIPLLARGSWQAETLRMRPRFGEGLIGWAVANARPVISNEAHIDPRAANLPGTPSDDPEAIMCLPLVSAGVVIGAFSLYREGVGQSFTNAEVEMAQHFADAVALALATAQAREELSRLARTDYLTGCLNRRGFDESLTTLCASAREKEESLSLILVDLDDFKSINDELGHHSGDLVLVQVADRLARIAREGSVVARLGGDEFGVAFSSDSEGEAEAFANMVARAIREIAIVVGGASVSVTASVGSCELGPDERNVESALLRGADTAMYHRKRAAAIAGRRTAAVGETT